MATIDTGSFLDSYAAEAEAIQPTESQLLRAYQNIELADNAQAEQDSQRELLAPRGPSPEMQAQLKAATAYAMSMEDADDITLADEAIAEGGFEPWGQVKASLGLDAPKPTDWKTSEFEMYGEEGAPLQPETELLSQAPAITPPSFEPPDTFSPFGPDEDMGKIAQTVAREARPLGAVKGYDSMPFKGAFRAALDDGLQTFAWKGKQYTTQTKDMLKAADERQATMPAALKIGESRITDIADLPEYVEPAAEPTEPEVTPQTIQTPYDVQEGATLEGMQPGMETVMQKISPVFEDLGAEQLITSGKRDKGGWSFHETGDALDVLFPDMSGEERDAAVEQTKQRLLEKLGAGYEIELSNHGTGWHLHIEQETDASRMRLHEHGKKHGIKPKDVKSASSRAQYKSFLKSVN
jgi:hypothetical protein